jgi:hypothetical protein
VCVCAFACTHALAHIYACYLSTHPSRDHLPVQRAQIDAKRQAEEQARQAELSAKQAAERVCACVCARV